MYEYKKSKETIEKILKSPTKVIEKSAIPSSDSEFTYENGLKSWVGALFVDIVNSSKLFENANEDTARIIRSFCSEIISILKDDSNYREIGIRGDCVYCIYNAPYQTDLVEIFRHAYRINSFMSMLNKLLQKNGYSAVRVGIGLGCGEDLIIKAGQNGSGINDKIWIGKAVVDAAHLSDVANRNGVSPIAMSPLFYDNVIKHLCKENEKYKSWISAHTSGYYGSVDYYHCSIIETGFDKWIEENI
ncbi:MAG: adenylate cyclase [Clostridia bacterium]|nr:adenylate cyclase [Clostridia bacterium]